MADYFPSIHNFLDVDNIALAGLGFAFFANCVHRFRVPFFVRLRHVGIIISPSHTHSPPHQVLQVNTRATAEKRKDSEYREANAVAEELLESVRTVQACNGQDLQHARYAKFLHQPEQEERRAVVWFNVSSGLIWSAAFAIPAANWFMLAPTVADTSDISLKQFFLVEKIPVLLTKVLGMPEEQKTLLENFDQLPLNSPERKFALTVYLLFVLTLCWMCSNLVGSLIGELGQICEFIQAYSIAKIPMSRVLDCVERAKRTREAVEARAVSRGRHRADSRLIRRSYSKPNGGASEVVWKECGSGLERMWEVHQKKQWKWSGKNVGLEVVVWRKESVGK